MNATHNQGQAWHDVYAVAQSQARQYAFGKEQRDETALDAMAGFMSIALQSDDLPKAVWTGYRGQFRNSGRSARPVTDPQLDSDGDWLGLPIGASAEEVVLSEIPTEIMLLIARGEIAEAKIDGDTERVALLEKMIADVIQHKPECQVDGDVYDIDDKDTNKAMTINGPTIPWNSDPVLDRIRTAYTDEALVKEAIEASTQSGGYWDEEECVDNNHVVSNAYMVDEYNNPPVYMTPELRDDPEIVESLMLTIKDTGGMEWAASKWGYMDPAVVNRVVNHVMTREGVSDRWANKTTALVLDLLKNKGTRGMSKHIADFFINDMGAESYKISWKIAKQIARLVRRLFNHNTFITAIETIADVIDEHDVSPVEIARLANHVANETMKLLPWGKGWAYSIVREVIADTLIDELGIQEQQVSLALFPDAVLDYEPLLQQKDDAAVGRLTEWIGEKAGPFAKRHAYLALTSRLGWKAAKVLVDKEFHRGSPSWKAEWRRFYSARDAKEQGEDCYRIRKLFSTHVITTSGEKFAWGQMALVSLVFDSETRARSFIAAAAPFANFVATGTSVKLATPVAA